MAQLVNHAGCTKCRAAGSQYGQDGFQLCLHHAVVTPRPERDSIPLHSLPGPLDPHRDGAMLPQEHYVVLVGDLSTLHKYVHEGDPPGCRECNVDGSQYAKKLCLRPLRNTKGPASSVEPGNEGSYVNEGVEALHRITGYRVHMYSPTICFQPREDI